MRRLHGRAALAALTVLALALPAGAAASALESDEHDAWQGQGQGRGNDRGNDDRGNGQGNQGRGNDDRGNAQGTQGRGNDDRGNAQGNRGRGNDDRANADGSPGRSAAAPGRGGAGRGVATRRDRVDMVELRTHVERLPSAVRRFADSDRRSERLVAGALARASLRGLEPSRLRIVSEGPRIVVRNDDDDILLNISEERARELGHWEMRRLGDRTPREGSPAFCRSGAGHPVWGREWCIEKGFGLGVSERTIWSRATVDDVVFRRRPDTGLVLDRDGLLDVLGDIVLGRLAVQSLVLGYDEPLAGRWVHTPEEPEAPWVLRVNAGDVVVAELVDRDRDDDVDVLFVSQPRW